MSLRAPAKGLRGFSFFVLAMMVLMFGQGARANQISWRCSPGLNNYSSEGAPNVLDGTYTFELGAFTAGFTPTAGNVGDWSASWTSLDLTVYNPNTKFFTSSVLLGGNSPPFVSGAKAWIWGHNQEGEWILLRASSWTWPTVTGGPGGPGGITWKVQDATEVVVGAVNGGGSPFHMMTADVGDQALPVISGDEWKALYFTPIELGNPLTSGWTADADGDGCSNAIEFAMGTDPRDKTSKAGPVISVEEDGGQRYQTMTVARPPGHDVIQVIEISDDLTTWESEPTSELVTLKDTILELKVRSATAIGNHCEFLRMAVQIP